MPAVGKPRKGHPDGWSSERIEQAPKASKTPSTGKPLGLDNSTRAALNTVKAVIKLIGGGGK